MASGRSSPAVVAELRVALVLGQEAAREVVVGVHHRAEGDKEGAEHASPDEVLAQRVVHLRDELSHVVVVLEVVAQARRRAGGNTAGGREHRERRCWDGSAERRAREWCRGQPGCCAEEAHRAGEKGAVTT
eukprot:CAMPEP_0171105374 /NCGR_PEP_ID=MMETSP0766_2-20121228/62557_1 /TAXON_ID=439317 /ORGANISM="Gambierdiscus australes, Strain CAWD 149" /LENGTH=130 /DNA_ID=CAMNT_0011566211 /DNA_START=56 /DNA_END=448 /DNA_ORIENTATION=+